MKPAIEAGWSFGELALSLGVSISTIRRWFRNYPRVAITKRTIRVPNSSLDQFIADHQPTKYVPSKKSKVPVSVPSKSAARPVRPSRKS